MTNRQSMAKSISTFLCLLAFSPLVHAQVEWAVGSAEIAGEWNTLDARVKAARHFPTLESAVKELAAQGTESDGGWRVAGLVIHLRPGVHRLSRSIVLGPSESGGDSAPIVFSGPEDKTAIVSGGKVLGLPSRIDDSHVLRRLPPRSRGSVVQFDLRKEEVREGLVLPVRRGFGESMAPGHVELFFRGKPMQLARWPNDGFATLHVSRNEPPGNRSFRVVGANLDGLAAEPALMATGYWGRDWADQTIPVESVDVPSGRVTLRSPSPRFGIVSGQRFFLQNALSELDSPGEWYLDHDAGILYFWPPAPVRKGDVEVSVLSSLVVAKDASNVRFRGITFEMVRGHAIELTGGRNVRFENVTIRNAGGAAARAVNGSGHLFDNADVHETGEGGIYLEGGNRTTLASGNLSVQNSRIRNFNRLSRTYRPAISLGGVGNRALGNLIADGTHSAIIFRGNEHLIAFNHISRVALETGDVGAIYTGRDWTARGTVIRNNYFHDIRGPGSRGSNGVYLDDQASGITVTSNLFVRVDRPIFIGGGRDNLIERNLMVASSPAIHVDARGLAWQRKLTLDPQWTLLERLHAVPYDQSPYRERYPNLASILKDDLGAPKYNVIRNNIVVAGDPFELIHGAEHWVTFGPIHTPDAATLRSGVAALESSTAKDFAVGDTHVPDGTGITAVTFDAMDCVATRWQKAGSGRAPQACKVH